MLNTIKLWSWYSETDICDNVSEDEAIAAIERLVDARGSHYAAVVNAAKIVAAATDERLKRGLLPRFESDDLIGTFQPQGLVLEPNRDLLLHDEEVPREGARVTRAYQYARWVDGSTHLWIGRRKQPGRGEGSSGLRFDIVE